MMAISELVSSEALRRYDDNGDPVYSTHERVLLVLRWFDWATAERICDALDLDAHLPALRAERQRFSKALAYWVKRGRVEIRRDFGVVEYRLRPRSNWQKQIKCTRCSLDAISGKTMCQRHLDWERDYKSRRRAESTGSLRVA